MQNLAAKSGTWSIAKVSTLLQVNLMRLVGPTILNIRRQTASLAAQTTSALANFTDLGVYVELDRSYQVGTHVEGSYFIIANDTNQVSITSNCQIISSNGNTFFGGANTGQKIVMVDPLALFEQPWDNRVTGPGFGPGMSGTYNANLATVLPATISVSTKPKTVWFYRGLDNVQNGGAYTGCSRIVQVTIYPKDLTPRINPIKPSGFDGPKEMYSTADISYNKFTPVDVPSGATEPNWDGYGMLARGLYNTGFFGTGGQTGVFNPWHLHAETGYPAWQAPYTAQVLLGAISNVSRRQELVNRVVTCGLDLHQQVINGYANTTVKTTFNAGGGFGYGYRAVKFLAGYWLNRSDMMAKQADRINSYVNANTATAFMGEDGISWWGTATSGYPYGNWPTQRPNYGTISFSGWPAQPFNQNHDARDPDGIREPTSLARSNLSNSVVTANATTITLSNTAQDKIIVSDENSALAIVAGTGAGQVRRPIAWDNTNMVATVGNAAGVAQPWDVIPDATSKVEYYYAGGYQQAATQATFNTTLPVVIMGLTSEWGTDDHLWGVLRRWPAEGGRLGPIGRSIRYYDGDVQNARAIVYQTNDNWAEKFWLSIAKPIHPFNINQGAPVLMGANLASYDSSSITVRFVTDKDNGTIYVMAQPAANATPNSIQVMAAVDGSGNRATSNLTVAAPDYGGNSESYQINSLAASTSYKIFAVHKDSANQVSNVLLAATQTTAPPDFAKVVFDGTNDYLSKASGLTGAVDTNQLTIVFRVRVDATANFRYIFSNTNDGLRALIRPNTNWVTFGALRNSDQNYYYEADLQTSGSVGAFITYYMKMNDSTIQAYEGNTSVSLGSVNDLRSGSTLDWTYSSFTIGAASGGATKFEGQMQFLWIDKTDLDFSNATVRNAFTYNNIGTNGEGPTGSAPLVYFSGNAAVWNAGTNKGTGGNFTMNGSVTDA
jgi:hypothetical protein